VIEVKALYSCALTYQTWYSCT